MFLYSANSTRSSPAWIATATNAYRDHPLYGMLVRQAVVASGGIVKRPSLAEAGGA